MCVNTGLFMHNKSMNPTVKRLRQRQVRKIMITPMQPCNFLGFPFYRLAVITAISLEPIVLFISYAKVTCLHTLRSPTINRVKKFLVRIIKI